jgi:hypothetical protein
VDATSKRYREASFVGAYGVVRPANLKYWAELTTPSARKQGGFAFFYYPHIHPSSARRGMFAKDPTTEFFILQFPIETSIENWRFGSPKLVIEQP